MGIDPERLVPAPVQQARQDDYELWPEHAMAWTVYQGCTTQWRRVSGLWGGGGLLGLDYGGVEVVMRCYEVPETQRGEVFAQLQVLESETVLLLNRQ